jgi:hypothetical protein
MTAKFLKILSNERRLKLLCIACHLVSDRYSGRNVLVINKEQGWIGHRLNMLGIRVWPDRCQLVAKAGKEWITLGPPRNLPFDIPKNADELASAADDPLLITAYQYVAEFPDSDLMDMLSKRKDFESVINSKP